MRADGRAAGSPQTQCSPAKTEMPVHAYAVQKPRLVRASIRRTPRAVRFFQTPRNGLREFGRIGTQAGTRARRLLMLERCNLAPVSGPFSTRRVVSRSVFERAAFFRSPAARKTSCDRVLRFTMPTGSKLASKRWRRLSPQVGAK